MGWQLTPLVIPMFLALAVSLSILGYLVVVYRGRLGDPLVVLYFWATVAAVVWTGFSTLKLLQTDPTTKLLFFRFLHLGAAVLPPLIFLFVVAFTDRHRWLRTELVGALFLLPTVFLLLLFFAPDGVVIGGKQVFEGDIVVLRVTNGPGFSIFAAYSLLLVIAALTIVLLETRRFGPAYYPQAALISTAVLVPVLFSALTMAEVPPFVDDRINLVPTAGAVSVVLFGVLLYRYRLVELPPLAYATAMKYSPDALLVLDQDRQVVSANEHGNELLDALDGSLGTPLSESVPAFDPESTSNELVELELSSKETTYHRVFVEPLTRGGRRVGWVVVLRDETDQQRQQKQLQEKTEQLELFASTISHDLRNPLNVAQGYLQLAQSEVDREELDKVESAHSRMEEIIEEVLALARAETQTQELAPVPVENVVERAWENVTTDRADLRVETDRTVLADRTMMNHVFENLIRNAVEHGGGGVTITVGDLDDGIYVEDDGAGIPPDEREAVFEVGYTGTTDGTGFGLSIIKQIVDAHDWEIEITESSGGGARFEMTDVEVGEPSRSPSEDQETAHSPPEDQETP
jgi:signal transduction histidine kinase